MFLWTRRMQFWHPGRRFFAKKPETFRPISETIQKSFFQSKFLKKFLRTRKGSFDNLPQHFFSKTEKFLLETCKNLKIYEFLPNYSFPSMLRNIFSFKLLWKTYFSTKLHRWILYQVFSWHPLTWGGLLEKLWKFFSASKSWLAEKVKCYEQPQISVFILKSIQN